MRRLLLATTNPNKVREVRALLRDEPVTLTTLADVPPVPEPEETGDTFEANARLKACYYATEIPGLVVSEDSGLVIDALHGEPGVRSARYAGEPSDDAANKRRVFSGNEFGPVLSGWKSSPALLMVVPRVPCSRSSGFSR